MRQVLPLSDGWAFRRLDASSPDPVWTQVDLPHSPKLVDLNGRDAWFGECEYQKTIALPTALPQGRRALYIGAAMHSVAVYVDGREVGGHVGGYLPFEIDLTEAIRDEKPHQLLLRLDNRDNADVPPGKPYGELDFCWHGGLYREAELRCYPEVFITEPVAAQAVASGGVFIRTLSADAKRATIRVQTHFANVGREARTLRLGVELLRAGKGVATREYEAAKVAFGETARCELDLTISSPSLWQPDSPDLYTARVNLMAPDGTVLDQREERFGIRTLSFTRSGGFSINHRRCRLRGVNRHQEYPYVGYALPPAAHRRDARRIKEAGFDYVRLSHYPQSPAFLDACDEYGIVVMNCVPGWQFMGGDKFREMSYQNARDLIRRDRNHPCVVLWELSLNETQMDENFMSTMHRIGHEEYPGDQMFTCGWIDGYDVYIHARQHGEMHRWRNGDKALVISEYGDWEFYASNTGFDQKTGSGLFADWSHGRQLRAAGERRLRQQATNHVIALNDTLSSPAVLDGLWSMFDYTRGYDAQRAACGLMDVFRIPKFSYHFFRSQRDIAEGGRNWAGGPVVFIASYYEAGSDLRILVFSNCEEIELKQNGLSLGRRGPDRAWMTQFLSHAPFVFELSEYIPGTLEAVGYCGDKALATHRIAAPGEPSQLVLSIDDQGVYANADEPDLLIAHAALMDQSGTLCTSRDDSVSFAISGDAEIIGPASIVSEAGIASVVLRLPPAARSFTLSARSGADLATYAGEILWHRPLARQSTLTSAEGLLCSSTRC